LRRKSIDVLRDVCGRARVCGDDRERLGVVDAELRADLFGDPADAVVVG
jgi:hypothetical protein